MSITRIKRKKGFVYKARIDFLDGTSISRTCRNINDAKKFESDQTTVKAVANGKSESQGKIRVDDFVEVVWKPTWKSTKGASTRAAYDSHYRLYLKPVIGHKKLNEIRVRDGEIIQDNLVRNGNNSKGNNYILRTLRTMLNFAVDRDYLLKNPLKALKPLKEPKKLDTFWEAHEAKQFLEVNKDHFAYPIFVTALNTGMRRGELAALKWHNIDLDRKRILVTGTRDRYDDKDETKSKADRTIPMNARLFNLLAELKLRQSDSTFVFLNNKDRPINPQHMYRLMDTLRLKAGIQKKIRFHDLRHTYASHFMMNGGQITQLSLILGHTDFKVTRRYIHFAPNYLDSASEVVSF